ncbi:hypothetical protein GW590_08355 [Rahnella sp. SAP-1]|uniref:Uncharacterized protein n=1 Tax=Rouxiella aceris TaxID=2703884 RepID=A0A848MKZ5_9GAMM|nr:hypothetical protein [Rouxiella aceris]NMP26874.1 hypothetical protein [Rouxiella aceris]
MIDRKAQIEAFKMVERNAHEMVGNPDGYKQLTGLCPVAMVERQAQRLAELLTQLDEAEAALAAQRQRADECTSCDRHFVDGMKQGWNFHDAGNSQGFTESIERVQKDMRDGKVAGCTVENNEMTRKT